MRISRWGLGEILFEKTARGKLPNALVSNKETL
jgi:hypothetical protein